MARRRATPTQHSASGEPFTVRVTLPPTTNHAYHLVLVRGLPRLAKTAALDDWESANKLLVGTYEPPAGVALRVDIKLEVPARLLWSVDIDGFNKALIDLVVGKRRDHKVIELHVGKLPGDGWAEITVTPAEQ